MINQNENPALQYTFRNKYANTRFSMGCPEMNNEILNIFIHDDGTVSLKITDRRLTADRIGRYFPLSDEDRKKMIIALSNLPKKTKRKSP